MGAVLGSGQGARPHRERRARGRTWRQGRRVARAKGISTVPPFQEHLSLELSRTHTRAPKQKGSESRVGAQGLWSSPTALIGWHLSPPRGRAPLTGLVAGTARQQGHLAQAQGPEAAGSPLPAVSTCCPSAEGKGPSLSWVGRGQQGHPQVGAKGRPCSGQPAAAPVPRQGRDGVSGGRGPVEPPHALSPVGQTCAPAPVGPVALTGHRPGTYPQDPLRGCGTH